MLKALPQKTGRLPALLQPQLLRPLPEMVDLLLQGLNALRVCVELRMLDLGADKVQIVYGLCRLHVGWLSERMQWFSRLVPCAQVRQVGKQAG